jgi:YD repeat-containing protein
MSTILTTTSPQRDWQLARDAFGKLVLTRDTGERFDGVVPVRAFPVQSPDDGIGLVSTDGKEVAWIDRLADLPPDLRQLIADELAGREFMPEITRIVGVTSFSTPCTWTVDTDRGRTEFVLRGDEDIRRIGTEGNLLVADIHGIHYLVRNHMALDAHSRKILDRFL